MFMILSGLFNLTAMAVFSAPVGSTNVSSNLAEIAKWVEHRGEKRVCSPSPSKVFRHCWLATMMRILSTMSKVGYNLPNRQRMCAGLCILLGGANIRYYLHSATCLQSCWLLPVNQKLLGKKTSLRHSHMITATRDRYSRPRVHPKHGCCRIDTAGGCVWTAGREQQGR